MKNILDIEKQIVDLVIREKELAERRAAERADYLRTAENHPTVQRITENLMIKGLGIDRRSISRYSQEGKCTGANDEEYLSDVLVTVFASTPEYDPQFTQCADLSVKVRITGGFDNPAIRETERVLTGEIMKIRQEIEMLKNQKRLMRDNASGNGDQM